jgi:hypothetical protein
MYIQIYRQHGKLIDEQQVYEENPLFKYARPPNTLKQYTTGRAAGEHTQQQKQVGWHNTTITIEFNAHNYSIIPRNNNMV